MRIVRRVMLVLAAGLALGGCMETAMILDETANDLCRQNPTPECYDEGRI